MATLSTLHKRDCPVCGALATVGEAFLESYLDENRLNGFSYSSRKTPEYMCFRMLRCPVCDIVYACESPADGVIGQAYRSSDYDSKREASYAAEAYERALQPYLTKAVDTTSILDIGTGTGAFLQRMAANGFKELKGIEPSRAAIEAADPSIKACIQEGLFSASDFPPRSFAWISCFMTLEHVPDPLALVRDCHILLKPGGMMVAVVHDWRAWNNRLLGRRAPIVDIEHLQLFSKSSITELFRIAGFRVIRCGAFSNRYDLDYWNRLLPLPPFLKNVMGWVLRKTRIGRIRLSLNVGNLLIVARPDNLPANRI
jgi:SAM-dependent methyltransferase